MVEQAAGGTLFLDEVGDLSPESQSKLLRFIEEGEFYRVGGTKKLTVHTRVISATNRDLQKESDAGNFRKDLYYRLAVVKVRVPSLRERPSDIVPIALHFLHEFGRKFGKEFTGISPEAQEALRHFRWKGNVRELRNVIERGALVGKGPQLSPGDLGLPGQDGVDVASGYPPIPPKGIDLPEMVATMERHYYDEALARTGGNEARAASLLGINHHTFRYQRRKMRR
jgi:DNA-binding NtrC family response regulator